MWIFGLLVRTQPSIGSFNLLLTLYVSKVCVRKLMH